MQNIIVADEACAKKAITALKVNQSGRLTFLPVTSIRSKKVSVDRELKNENGFCGMGVELIDTPHPSRYSANCLRSEA